MQINYSNKNMLLGAMIVGGWDPERGGQIYGVPIGGTLVEQAWTTDGSGSTYIWGYLDAAYRCLSFPKYASCPAVKLPMDIPILTGTCAMQRTSHVLSPPIRTKVEACD